MSTSCLWLHEQLEILPIIRFPFEITELPKNGIYFLYEDGEKWGHGSNKSRIVRIGTHKGDNFKNRISEHYLLDDRKMNFKKNNPKPSDRSIFRKNLGRVLLNQMNDPYLSVWEIDFMKRINKEESGYLRNVEKERDIESRITQIIRGHFIFRFLLIEDQIKRIGEKGLEKHLIGTVGRCQSCKPSKQWIGGNSPVNKIAESGLWQVQHLNSNEINTKDMKDIEIYIQVTLSWLES